MQHATSATARSMFSRRTQVRTPLGLGMGRRVTRGAGYPRAVTHASDRVAHGTISRAPGSWRSLRRSRILQRAFRWQDVAVIVFAIVSAAFAQIFFAKSNASSSLELERIERPR
jgi:hypothetical protein